MQLGVCDVHVSVIWCCKQARPPDKASVAADVLTESSANAAVVALRPADCTEAAGDGQRIDSCTLQSLPTLSFTLLCTRDVL